MFLINIRWKNLKKKFKELLRILQSLSTVQQNLGVKGEKLVKHLKSALDNVKVINSYTFTSKDYANMIIKNILDRGIEVKDKKRIIMVLGEVVSD